MPSSSEAIDLLQQLVSIPSLSGQEGEASAWLAGWMAAHGYTARLDGAGNAVGSRGDGPRRLLLLGHIDTFPGELPVRLDGEWLYGRGTVDAKGALCAFAAAAAAVQVPPGWQVMVVGAVEEEAATSRGARYLLCPDQPAPDVCVIGEPSGWDRITLGYKGRLLVEVRLRAPFAHSASHARLPAEQAVDLWNAVVAYCDHFNAGRDKAFDRLDPSLRHIANHDEGAYGIAELSLGFRLPPGLLPEALADELRRVLSTGWKVGRYGSAPCGLEDWKIGRLGNSSDSSLPRPDDPQRGERSPAGPAFQASNLPTIQPLAPSPQSLVALTFSGAEVAFRAEKNTPLVRAFLAAIRQQDGQARFVVKTGTSDMNVVGPVWNCPICAYGPGDSALDHTPDERINLTEYLQSIRVLESLLKILMKEG